MSLLLLLACQRSGEGADPRQIGALNFEGHPPKNLLWIGIDTLRRDAVGRYSGVDDTPFLDQILSEGVALDDHRACSNWTFSGLLCTMSGRTQLELGYAPSQAEIMPEEIALLPDYLSERGFATSLVTNNSFVGPSTGYELHFEQSLLSPDKDAASLHKYARQAMDQLLAGPEPWFLQLHYVDPHFPYEPPEGWAEGIEELPPLSYDIETTEGFEAMAAEWEQLSAEDQALILAHLRARYAGEVAWWDASLRGMLRELEGIPGALEDTLVVLWSDHGEQLWEHGHYWHGMGLYLEENAAVGGLWTLPAEAGGPGLAPLVWGGPTVQEDLYATALAALQLEADPLASGRLLDEEDPERARYALRAHRDYPEATVQTVEQSGLRLYYAWSGQWSLYDLAADPGETRDLYSAGDPDAVALQALLQPQVDALTLLLKD